MAQVFINMKDSIYLICAYPIIFARRYVGMYLVMPLSIKFFIIESSGITTNLQFN